MFLRGARNGHKWKVNEMTFNVIIESLRWWFHIFSDVDIIISTRFGPGMKIRKFCKASLKLCRFCRVAKSSMRKRHLIFKMWIDIFRCQSHTFQGLSLQLAAGESVPWATSAVIPDIPVFVCPRTCALVGASGCGKSAAEQYLFAWSCFGGFGWWHVHVFQRKLHELPEPQPFGCCWATSKWLLVMFA